MTNNVPTAHLIRAINIEKIHRKLVDMYHPQHEINAIALRYDGRGRVIDITINNSKLLSFRCPQNLKDEEIIELAEYAINDYEVRLNQFNMGR